MAVRLDQFLADRGLTETRSRARDLIRRGRVTVDSETITKPAFQVGDTVEVSVSREARDVSRGAEKLRAALAAFAFDVAGRTFIDVGASTGGFTQALLDAGAAHVTAVDVGRGQLAPALAADARVANLEQTDARTLTAAQFDTPPDGVVADVSFVSVRKVLGPALAVCRPGSIAVILIKPQFELSPDAIGKGGIVRSAEDREMAKHLVTDWVGAQPGWRVIDVIPSPITGGDGNAEWLAGARRDG